MTFPLQVIIEWSRLHDDHDGWDAMGCLYAYQAPRGKELLYIGKAWGVSVRGRWQYAAKSGFWDDLETQRNIRKHIPLVGELWLPERNRLTSKLLADVESLLIHQVQPWGNIQCINSRRSRPGLEVRCRGEWPLPNRTFCDE